MTQTKVADDWQASARSAIRQQRAAWLGTIMTGLMSGLLFGLGGALTDPVLQPIVLGAACLLMVAALIWGTLIYMRVIDEQERDANLWGTYVGMTVYLVLFAIKWIAELTHVAVPLSEQGIFTATMAAVLAVFTWKRFR